MLGLDTPASPRSLARPPRYADVAVPRRLHRTFTYAIPTRLTDQVRVGSLVRIPFGSVTVTGLVVALSPAPPRLGPRPGAAARGCREILSVRAREDVVEEDGERMSLAHWLSDRYLAPLGQCLRLLVPPGEAATPTRRYRLTEGGRAGLDGGIRASAASLALARCLAERPEGATLATLKRLVSGPVAPALRRMKARGWVREDEDPRSGRPRRKPSLPETTGARTELIGSEGRVPAWPEALEQALQAERFVPVLLQASAEARLPFLERAAASTLAQGRTVLAITGAVGPAAELAARCQARWGERVQLLHGRLSARARVEAWTRITQGQVDLVVGTRSAVFAPLRRLGLLVVDAEDDPSLKEEQAPRYHARDVAWQRARQCQATLLLGATHPSLDSLAAVRGEGLHVTPDSFREDRPVIELVDLRALPYGTLLSPALVEGIRRAVAAGTGAVLYHNRKGFSPALSCRDCGAAPRCARCSVTLTLHRGPGELRCHVCGACAAVPDRCPDCLGARLEPVGAGTEALEDEVRRRFPGARIARLDRTALRGARWIGELRGRLLAGELDIVLGTQLLFQASPLPRVGFVGVPFADLGLHHPDFRAGERTHRSLAAAVGLARSHRDGGRALLQTRLPRHPVLEAVVSGDPAPLYEEELAVRQALDYPPCATLVCLRVGGPDPLQVEAAARAWAAALEGAMTGGARTAARPPRGSAGTPTVCGPIRSPLHQVRGQSRLQLVVRGRDGDAVRHLVRTSLAALEEGRARWGRVKFEVDVDPLSL